ncbi:MAG: NADP-dependent isocitrate dehydrogenase [Bacteriovoracales bacterium]|nr:NADP-dependent isocitrate dehydrogenase [Bacteriovoracales bacterium]
MSEVQHRIVYTLTDEAPALATYSWLPIVEAFTEAFGIRVERADISLAARMMAAFPESLSEEQRMPDALAKLGELVQEPEAFIIKLPNISASLPQLKEAIAELQTQGLPLPGYPEGDELGPQDEAVRACYAKVLGSAVNPVLREGNSERRAAKAVKRYAKKHPHTLAPWDKDSKSRVVSMERGDFYSSEKSFVAREKMEVKIEWTGKSGRKKILKDNIALEEGEVVDGAAMNCRELRAFFQKEMDRAKEEGLLLSLHLKATMMKVSDPIIFGHAVEIFYREVFEKHRREFINLGLNPRDGLAAVWDKLYDLDDSRRKEIARAIREAEGRGGSLAMVDSEKGIGNLHLPNLVIIDASMPVAIRDGGKMWGADGKLHDTSALIPDRCYGGIYREVMDFCREHGAFDVGSMGHVSNVGLMAKKAQEYGSHDKTFEIEGEGTVRVVGPGGQVLLEHEVGIGDIWRMCQTKQGPIEDWVKLAIKCAKKSGAPAVFWLDPKRSHDTCLMEKIAPFLQSDEAQGVELAVMSPVEAIRYTLKRLKDGQDTISVTGNVLRDYLTDLFPILELGTSAKMLSIVSLLSGGKLYETGAGGSAPKHVGQFVRENHLRWDSLGEFLALAVSLEDLAERTKDKKVEDLAKALNRANERFLEENKSPSRRVGELDTRGSHFYLALFWAQSLAQGIRAPEIKKRFEGLYAKLRDNEAKIVNELAQVQGPPTDVGGHYRPDPEKLAALMRPSKTFNAILETL